jgi:hypothetical protein
LCLASFTWHYIFKFIYIAAFSSSYSFLWLHNIPLYGYTTCCSSVRPLVDMIWSHFLAIVTSAAANICAHVFA